jgi:hypothetical protein
MRWQLSRYLVFFISAGSKLTEIMKKFIITNLKKQLAQKTKEELIKEITVL